MDKKSDKNLENGNSGGEIQWAFNQVKGSLDDLIADQDIISCVEFNHDGELLATGDKGGRVVIFQRDDEYSGLSSTTSNSTSNKKSIQHW